MNVPKADESVLLGKEFRSLFTAPEGLVNVGADAAALENRVAGHYTYNYDGGAYARELLEGDVHTSNAEAYSKAAGKEITRSKGKNITYGILYGAQPKKIAKMLDAPLKTGKAVYEAFWANNKALSELKDYIISYWESTGKRFLIGLDGRKIYTRSQHSLLNALFQSAGAIIMDRAGILFQEKVGKLGIKYQRWAYQHDEYQVYCHEFDADTVGKLIVDSIIEAGEYYSLNVPLDGEYKVGKNWAETH